MLIATVIIDETRVCPIIDFNRVWRFQRADGEGFRCGYKPARSLAGTFVNPAARLQRVQMDRRCVALAIFLCQAFPAASGNHALFDADSDHFRAKRGGFLAKCQITAAKNGLDARDNAHKNAHAEFAYRDTVDALIDYAYGRYNIHAYTIEVYSPGKSEDGDISSCKWENTMPEATWVFYSRDEIRDTLGLDPDTITDSDGVGLAEGEGLWFYTSSTNQMVNRAPEEQDVMVRGCRDAILTMMESEPNGKGYQNPGFYK